MYDVSSPYERLFGYLAAPARFLMTGALFFSFIVVGFHYGLYAVIFYLYALYSVESKENMK